MKEITLRFIWTGMTGPCICIDGVAQFVPFSEPQELVEALLKGFEAAGLAVESAYLDDALQVYKIAERQK